MWQCVKCDERSEDSFEACWKCGASKSGVPAVANKSDAESTSSKMPECPKCGKKAVMENVRTQGGRYLTPLSVVVERDPQGFLSKEPVTGDVVAKVCGSCGFTEFYVSNPGQLLKAYRQSQQRPLPPGNWV